MNNTTPAVLAAMEIVEALAAAPEGLSQAVLASSIGLSTSTTYRILRSLAARGWVYKGSRGIYRLGSGLLAVACAVETEHEALLRSRETLERLASEHGIACKLSIRRGMQQVIYARAEPESPFHTTGQEGRAFPLVEGSSGVALLCDFQDADAAALFAAAPSAQTNLAFLLDGLKRVRDEGWCFRKRIANWPISAMSAPVRDEAGKVFASLSFIVPEDRFDDPGLAELLLASARECGGNPSGTTTDKTPASPS